MLQQQKENLLW